VECCVQWRPRKFERALGVLESNDRNTDIHVHCAWQQNLGYSERLHKQDIDHNIARVERHHPIATVTPTGYVRQHCSSFEVELSSMHHDLIKPWSLCRLNSNSAEYQPSVADVFRVKRYLQSQFPAKFVDRIIDDASYWPHSSIHLERPLTVIVQQDGKNDVMYIRTLPLGIRGTEGDFSLVEKDLKDNGAAWTKKLRVGGADGPSWSTPTLPHPCRKIEFQLWSHDQGWGGAHPGTYRESYTWFDVGVQKLQAPIFANSDIIEWPAYLLFEEFDEEPCSIPTDPARPFLPHATTLQKNIVGKSQTMEHTIVWHFLNSYDEESAEAMEAVKRGRGSQSLDGKFVRSIQVGDCITLWARARFPGWENHVQKAEVTVYWAV
jgi:hypothetical protein